MARATYPKTRMLEEIQKANNFSTVELVVAGTFSLAIGLFLFLYPKYVRKQDQGITKYIKDDREYAKLVRALGGIFVFISGVIAVLIVFLLLGLLRQVTLLAIPAV